ncbi:MAG: nitrate/nitrite transporter NrtS [Chloroflexi bacterium]|nr:nitrate/nitrite transporter NrtS [Chloroflexota bacterium]
MDRLQSWVSAASNRTLLRRSVVTCLVVGAILTAINQGDRLLRGELDAAMGLRIGLTFLVPFVVATLSGAAVIRSRDDSSGG